MSNRSSLLAPKPEVNPSILLDDPLLKYPPGSLAPSLRELIINTNPRGGRADGPLFTTIIPLLSPEHQRLVEAMIRELAKIEGIEIPAPSEREPEPLGNYISAWQNSLDSRGFSPGSMELYRRLIAGLLAKVPPPITTIAIERYIASRRESKISPTTIKNDLKAAKSFSDQIGIPIRLWPGQLLLEWGKKLRYDPVPRKELRPYQEAAVDALDTDRSVGRQHGLVVMAAGLGKTRIAGEITLREILSERGTEVLVLAHTVDLVHQLEAALWEVLPKDVSTHIWAGGEHVTYAGGVTCATMQSIIQAAKSENLAGRYSLVIVDEAHHAPADGYRELLKLLEPAFLLGLTATPWRSDERLLSDMFGPPIFSMSIVEGMQQGYLADVDYRMLVDDIDWEQVPGLTRQNLTIRELNRRLFIPQRDESIIAKIVEHLNSIESPRCIIFCRTIEHATSIRKLLRAAGKPCRVIHSQLGRVQATNVLREFRSGRVPTLISVDMLNEGIDVPDVNVVVFLRVTHSRRIFVQQLGRGLRLQEGKSTVRVLDFVADIRRIAAGLRLNKEAAEFAGRSIEKETLRFPDGRVVQFSNDRALDFFLEYLKDVTEVEDLDEGARLRYPPPVPLLDEP